MQDSLGRKLLNKVPEITLYFWIIKVLGTTVGETFADFLNINLNLGLTGTSVVMGALFLVALVFQLHSKKYIPSLYWLTVVLISVFGTLVTDNLTDALGIPLQVSTLIFSALLAGTFAVWYANEKTLSIHSIFTRKREIFYWLAILFTFALGTASGDLMAEGLGLGYSLTGVIIAVVIGVLAVAWRMGLDSILAFWLIYILTRPLGASLGDFLSQTRDHGGLGLGPTITSFIFLFLISALVIFLTFTKKDITTEETVRKNEKEGSSKHPVAQMVITLLILMSLAGVGYYTRQSALQKNTSPTVSSTLGSTAPLGDLSNFKVIGQDTLNLVNQNDVTRANKRVNDLEYEWDNAQSRLKSMNGSSWRTIDGKIDKVLRELRSTSPNQQTTKVALQDLIDTLNKVSPQ